ncbi:MAG: hypothetical protein MJA84_04020, partial [Firmicutes bacterium]|nr:hypothetical protein [Bacillota bacterium]
MAADGQSPNPDPTVADAVYDDPSPISVSDAAYDDVALMSVAEAVYWTDDLTAEPEGFADDGSGDVTVSSAEGLAWLAVLTNGLNGQEADTFEGKTVTLLNDIDLSGKLWTSIGKYKDKHIGRGNFDIIHDTPFKGTFDGGNNTIEGLDINIIIDEDIDVRVFNTGLFGKLAENGSIRDLTISGATISGDSHIGAVAGAIENGVIENVNTSDCSITARGSRAGGIAGLSLGFVSISNCNISGLNISAASGEAGGIIGCVQGIGNVISSCTVSGSQVETDGEKAGGIVGFLYEYFRTENDLEISRCSFNGTVSAKELAGGIAGQFLPDNDYSISECFVDAEITAEDSAGGIAGSARNIVNCYSKGKVTATDWGAGGITEEGSVKSSYSTAIVNGKIYPGGITGSRSSAYQIVDCLALNPSVAAEESEYYDYNRVFPVHETISGNGEFVRNAATGQRNYAYSDMRLSEGEKLIYCPAKERKLSGGDGEDVTYEELADES